MDPCNPRQTPWCQTAAVLSRIVDYLLHVVILLVLRGHRHVFSFTDAPWKGHLAASFPILSLLLLLCCCCLTNTILKRSIYILPRFCNKQTKIKGWINPLRSGSCSDIFSHCSNVCDLETFDPRPWPQGFEAPRWDRSLVGDLPTPHATRPRTHVHIVCTCPSSLNTVRLTQGLMPNLTLIPLC